MISIDTVYQKVLAVANKEQRGYITPQEFNLFVVCNRPVGRLPLQLDYFNLFSIF